jgi:N-acetylglucosaminyldiphosphoundecaprenol N-acetyl-beta-D-mannosaminyltransferase
MPDSVGPADVRVDVLGVGISAISLRGALAEIERWVREREHHYVCVTGVHGVIESQRDGELREIHNRSGLTVADGMPVFWSGKFAGSREIERVRGSDFVLSLCELAAERGWRNYFYGGAPGTPELLAERLRGRFPDLQVAGVYSPPFRPLSTEENDATVAEINRSGADLVWIGLSTPKQERWMAANVTRLDAAALLGVGMAFDVHAGLLPQAPRVIQNSGFEWLYRLWNEPRRLWRRYLYANPRFLIGVMRTRPRLRHTVEEGRGGDYHRDGGPV